MQLFLIIGYFVIIFIFVTPVPIGIRLVFDSNDKKPVFLIRFFNRNAELPKRDKKKKKSSFRVRFSYKKLQLNYIIIENFKIEIATPNDLPPILNYSLCLLLNTVDSALSKVNYDWYTNRSYISYVISDTDKIYFQCKADIKINLFIIFSMFFQTIKIGWRKNGSN